MPLVGREVAKVNSGEEDVGNFSPMGLVTKGTAGATRGGALTSIGILHFYQSHNFLKDALSKLISNSQKITVD